MPEAWDHYQYLLLMAGCVVITLPLEFVLRARVYSRPRRLLAALLPVVLLFLAWDVLGIVRGHWTYSARYTTGIVIPGLGAPWRSWSSSWLFRSAACSRTAPWTPSWPGRGPPLDPGAAAGMPGAAMPEYTVLAVLSVVAVVLAETLWWRTGLFRSGRYWISMGIVAFFQVLVDGWLTKLSAPIVLYAPQHILGVRVPWDIPVEDFLFGFTMVTLTILLWERAGRALPPRSRRRES